VSRSGVFISRGATGEAAVRKGQSQQQFKGQMAKVKWQMA